MAQEYGQQAAWNYGFAEECREVAVFCMNSGQLGRVYENAISLDC